jgi:AAA+ superfamily predicted ATPase
VHSAQDRYANADTGALLAKLERHDGITVLTTNLACQLDEAFERRLQLRLELPRPDARTRAALWSRMLACDAPLASDVNPALLAQRYDLSGAQIRNAVFTAALEAASAPAAERRITHAQLDRSAREQAGLAEPAQLLATRPPEGLPS